MFDLLLWHVVIASIGIIGVTVLMSPGEWLAALSFLMERLRCIVWNGLLLCAPGLALIVTPGLACLILLHEWVRYITTVRFNHLSIGSLVIMGECAGSNHLIGIT